MSTEKVKTANSELPIFGSHSALRNLIEEFRVWDNEWERYATKETKETTEKPKSVGDFMDEISEKYVVGYAHR